MKISKPEENLDFNNRLSTDDSAKKKKKSKNSAEELSLYSINHQSKPFKSSEFVANDSRSDLKKRKKKNSESEAASIGESEDKDRTDESFEKKSKKKKKKLSNLQLSESDNEEQNMSQEDLLEEIQSALSDIKTNDKQLNSTEESFESTPKKKKKKTKLSDQDLQLSETKNKEQKKNEQDLHQKIQGALSDVKTNDKQPNSTEESFKSTPKKKKKKTKLSDQDLQLSETKNEEQKKNEQDLHQKIQGALSDVKTNDNQLNSTEESFKSTPQKKKKKTKLLDQDLQLSETKNEEQKKNEQDFLQEIQGALSDVKTNDKQLNSTEESLESTPKKKKKKTKLSDQDLQLSETKNEEQKKNEQDLLQEIQGALSDVTPKKRKKQKSDRNNLSFEQTPEIRAEKVVKLNPNNSLNEESFKSTTKKKVKTKKLPDRNLETSKKHKSKKSGLEKNLLQEIENIFDDIRTENANEKSKSLPNEETSSASDPCEFQLSDTETKKKTDLDSKPSYPDLDSKTNYRELVYSLKEKEDELEDKLQNIQKKYGNIDVCLSMKVPELHKLETTLNRNPSGSLREQIESVCPNINKKKYSAEEDKIIKRNFEKFCKQHDLPHDPTPFSDYKVLKSVMSKKNTVKFAQFLAHTLNNRTLNSVYERFKILYGSNANKSGRLTRAEKEQIQTFLENTTSSTPFADLAKILGRDRIIIERHVKQCPIARFECTPENIEKLVSKLMKLTQCKNVDELREKDLSKLWVKVAEDFAPVNKTQLKNAWRRNIYPKLFMKNEELLTSEVKKKTINLLLKSGVSDWKLIDWKEIGKKVGFGNGTMLYKVFKRFVYYYVPSDLQSDLLATLNFLQEHVNHIQLKKASIGRLHV